MRHPCHFKIVRIADVRNIDSTSTIDARLLLKVYFIHFSYLIKIIVKATPTTTPKNNPKIKAVFGSI